MKLPRPGRRETTRAALVASAWLAAFLVLFPVWDLFSPGRSTVMLMARGQGDTVPSGSRVAIASFPEAFPSARWTANFDRDRTTVGDVAFPDGKMGVMAVSGTFGPDDAISLRTGRGYGVLIASVDGDVRSIDLHRDGVDSTTAFRPYDGLSPTKRALATAGVIPVGVAMAVALFLLLAMPRAAAPRTPPGRLAPLWLGLPCLLACGAVLAGTWPGQMSLDTLAQWEMLRTGTFTNHHPVTHTFLFVAPGWLAGSPVVTSLIQVAMLSVSFGWLLAMAWRLGTPPRAVVAASVLVPLLPPFHLLSTVQAKDVPYAVALAAMTAATLALASRGSARPGARLTAVIAATLFLAGGLRHNGLILVTGYLAILALAFPPVRKARVLAPLAVAGLALPLAITTVLVPLLGIAQVSPSVRAGPAIHVLAAAANGDAVDDPSTRALMEEAMPLADWARLYRCNIVDPVIFDRGFAGDRVDGRMYGAALRWAASHPAAFARHLGCVTGLLWKMAPTQLNTVSLGIDPSPQFKHLGLSDAPAGWLHGLFQAEARTALWPLGFLAWSPALLLLLLAAYAAHRHRLPGWGAVAAASAPVVLNAASLAPVIPAQELRYQYPVFLVVPVLALMLHFLPSPTEGAADGGTLAG